jgi:predicted TIM-barrel fold metal-dependent hydrolase
MIVDSQMHVWAANTPERPWPPGAHAHRDEPFGPDDALREMDRVGVDRCVLIPPRVEGGRHDLAIDAAERHPDRFAVIVQLPLTAGDAGAKQLEELHTHPAVLGARAMFSRDAVGYLEDGTADWLFETAVRLGIPVLASCPGRQHLIGKLAEKYPQLPITICHFGLPTNLRDNEIAQPVADLLALAQFPNIAVKASSLPAFVTDPYPFRSLFPHIKAVVEAYGARRVFWGSDVTRVAVDYAEQKSMFVDEMDFLSQADLELIMGKAICDWFGWPVAGA